MLTNEESRRLAHAQTALDQGEVSDAVAELVALDREVDSVRVNQTLARALVANQQFQAANQVITRHRTSYATTPALIDLVITVMLACQHFMALRQFLTPIAGVTAAQWARVTAGEEKAQHQLPTPLATRKRHFIHLGDRGFTDQQARFRAALDLPLTDFFAGAQFVLRDPAAHPLIRVSILQVLQQVDQRGTVKIEWLDGQEHSLELAQLLPLDQHPVTRAGLAWLAQRYQNDDPQSYQLYCREFLLQLTLLYPLIDAAVPGVSAWMTALTTPVNSGESAALTAARRWQSRLAGIVSALA